ncbi:MAG: winged helix-turn-helix domain-containing protein [Polyangiaceae bacterium]
MLYVFDDYVLDTRLFELRFRGEVKPLQPKPLDLLRYLVEHRDRVVLKSELLATLWPNVHVSDNALAQAVACVREALAHTQRGAIQSLRGRGYRFALDVDVRARSERTSDTAPRPARPRVVYDAADKVGLAERLAPLVAGGARVVRASPDRASDLARFDVLSSATVLVIDELERADAMTLALFATLARIHSGDVTVLGTCDFTRLTPSDAAQTFLAPLSARDDDDAHTPMERREADPAPLRVRSAS